MSLKPKLTWTAVFSFLQRHAPPVLVLFYQLIALASFAMFPLIASRWQRMPFLGAFLGHTLVVNDVDPVYAGSWEVQRLGLPFGTRLVELDGKPVRNQRDLNIQLSGRKAGERAQVSFVDVDGRQLGHEITLQDFSIADRLAYFIIPYFIGLIYLGSSIWMFTLRRNDTSGRAFSLFTSAMALSVAGLFDTYTTNLLTPLWVVSVALIGGALFNLTMLFPEEAQVISRYPSLRWAGYLPSLLLIIITLPALYNSRYPLAYTFLWKLEYFYAGLAAVFFLSWTIARRSFSVSPIVREQARLVLWGVGLSFGPLVLWFVLSTFRPNLVFSHLLLLPLAIFPVMTGYAILRYRLLNTDYLFSRATLYTLLSILASVGYALLVSGFSLIFGNAMPSNHPLLIGMMVFIFAILLQPLRHRMQAFIDGFFFRGQALYQVQLQAFGRQLTQTSELPAIIRLLEEAVNKAIHPSQLHIFILHPQSGQYLPDNDEFGKPTTDVRFPPNSVLVQALTQRRSSMFLGGSDTLPTLLQAERARLALLGVQLFVPLPGQTRLVGWLALGPRRSGDPYTNNDLRFLESLGDQAALAVERAQVVSNLERRVHEMDVLTRIAQGVNITLAFDDILELIYAQTNQLVPTRDMKVVLKTENQALICVFNLEDDERLTEKENLPLEPGQYLEEVVINTRRVIITDDYENECHSRGIPAQAPQIFAWVGVPLNAGADSIGAISLGSRDPALIFTEQQANLLQAIADQAAGAIVKARLLQESERRARQLATLNEVGKSLTSTLEIKPLLNQILESATEILNSEAGSLFMVDEQTNELIFEVTVGPVAGELVGQRLPPGTGLVGKAVVQAKPIIANDVRKTQGWSDSTDKQTGFVTRDLLVVPMMAQDRVIGVIEIINRKDGSPFDADDEGLLTTFASQATVAIENARLYTQTDEALTARVEELSVMQRIDRELNASLDVERAMRITLEWAMRQAHADAGLAGLLNGNEKPEQAIRVLASQGYDHLLIHLDPQNGDSHIPLELPSMLAAIDDGQPQALSLAENSKPREQALLDGTKTQVVIPIRRTNQVIGLILLESTQSDHQPKETIDFLSRLSDHAAIAISNAQLYADLQSANIAKSDFVSLVSHELKTPMTSIRGYADLLAQGVVGPINEVQTNFLNTIRSNVNRMATLVSDLADVSRIEAGRMRLEFSALSLDEVIQEVVRSQQGQIDEKKQTLNENIPLDLPLVWGDLNRVTQVLTNLLSNANKYTPPEGSITITAARADNQWDAAGPPQVVCVSVQDTGFGISPKDQEKIFQKFFRSEDQNIRETVGTGLGLNITRHLVEMQGGRIWFESELGKGTTFHFTIPVAATA